MTLIPIEYRWLLQEKSPKILIEAIKLLGIKEGPGAVNNQTILDWAKEVGNKVGLQYAHDSIAWCGLFIALCAQRAGLDVPNIAVRAKSWAEWGTPQKVAMLGDVLVFERAGGGHVGLYVGEDLENYHVLGGNQGDAVTIMRLSKARIFAIRRSKWKVAQPSNIRKIILAAKGVLSQNEA